MVDDPFDRAIENETALRELYERPMPHALRKQLDHVDEMARQLIALTPIVFVASHDADGRCDVTPRGGPPGFVTVLDHQHVAIPDATGNRRLDTLVNIVATGQAAMIFLIPGRDWTLRINGRACVSTDPALLGRLTAVGKPPRCAIVVRADELYTHCPKAFVRSRLWDPATWLAADDQPSPAQVTLAHLRDADVTLADVERAQEESLKHRLA